MWGSRRDHLDPGGVTELTQEIFASPPSLPGQAESPHVGHAKARDDARQDFQIVFLQLAFLDDALGPVDQPGQRDPMLQIADASDSR